MTEVRYHKIMAHFSLIGEVKNKDRVLLLVENEYVSRVSNIFWKNIHQEFKKKFGECSLAYYTVDNKTRRATYFDLSNKKITSTTLEDIFKRSTICFDLLTTGEAFYKKQPSFFKKIKRVVIIRLYSDSWQYFSYTDKEVVKIWNYTEKVKRFLLQKKNFEINDLEVTILKQNHICSYAPHPTSTFQAGEVRYLPLGVINIPTKLRTLLGVILTPMKVNGVINLKEALYEILTKRKGTKYEKLSMEIKNNKVAKFKIKERRYPLVDGFKVAHLTFGTNPFIRSHKNRVELAERKYGWACLGIEDSKNTHIDICFEHKLFRPGSKIFSRLI
jgi:hypothetical protein